MQGKQHTFARGAVRGGDFQPDHGVVQRTVQVGLAADLEVGLEFGYPKPVPAAFVGLVRTGIDGNGARSSLNVQAKITVRRKAHGLAEGTGQEAGVRRPDVALAALNQGVGDDFPVV